MATAAGSAAVACRLNRLDEPSKVYDGKAKLDAVKAEFETNIRPSRPMLACYVIAQEVRSLLPRPMPTMRAGQSPRKRARFQPRPSSGLEDRANSDFHRQSGSRSLSGLLSRSSPAREY
jgi:hypothetical protein